VQLTITFIESIYANLQLERMFPVLEVDLSVNIFELVDMSNV